MTADDRDKMNNRINDVETNVHGHIRALSDKFDTHHEILTDHIDRFRRHEDEEITRHNQFISSQSLNTKAINDLTESVAGVVETYKTANSVGKFIKWAAGIFVSIAILWKYIADQ